MDKHVHRRLVRGSRGSDVRQLQHGINRKAAGWKLPFLSVEVDGKLGPRTMKSACLLLFAMGVGGRPLKRARERGELSQYAQRLLRGTRRRVPWMVALSRQRRGEVRGWRRAHERSKVPEAIQRVIKEVNRLQSLRLPYVFGGGHISPAPVNGPFDCSSFASRLWQLLEPGLPTGTTYTLEHAGQEGAGKWFSLYIRNIAGRPDQSHVIVRIFDGKRVRWAQCGGRDNPAAGGGPSWFTPTNARIAEFPIHRHPAGY